MSFTQTLGTVKNKIRLQDSLLFFVSFWKYSLRSNTLDDVI